MRSFRLLSIQAEKLANYEGAPIFEEQKARGESVIRALYKVIGHSDTLN